MLCSMNLNKQGYGDKTHLVEELRNLKKLGNDVLLVAPGYKPISKEKFPFDVYYIPVGKKGYSTFIAYHFKLLWRIGKILEEFRPDVVYSRSIMNSFLIYKILKKRNIPLVIEQNDFVQEELIRMGYPFLFAKVIGLIDRANTHNCDGIVSVSVGLMRKLARAYALPESKFTVIQNGADPERCRPLNQKEMRRKFGLPETGFVVGYADYFRYYRKRLETLLKAGLILKEEGYNLKYVLINEGEAKDLDVISDLTKGYSLGEELFIFNKLDYFDFPQIINTFDIALVLRENWIMECTPVKFFEYLFSGIPVIYTRNVHENTYFPTRVGFRIKSLCVSELVEALRKALVESKEIKEELLLHREELVERYSWLGCAKRLEKFFQAKIKS